MAEPRSLPDDLLGAAEAEIAEHGLSALSLRAVARRVGVSHQAPGHHFQDRAGLLTALAVRGYRELVAAFHAAAADAPPDDPVATVTALGVAYVHFAVGHPALFVTMFRNDVLRGDDPDLNLARADAFLALGTAVHDAHQAGWGADRDEATLAMTCWSMVHGLASLWLDGALPAVFGTDDLDGAARAVTGALSAALSER